MIKTLYHLLRLGNATQLELFPDLPSHARGLPGVTSAACDGCRACEAACPTRAVQVQKDAPAPAGEVHRNRSGVTVDLGRCLACGECVSACKTGTIVARLDTRVASRTREQLVLQGGALASAPSATAPSAPEKSAIEGLFGTSFHVREVSTGDNASDLEIGASGNPIFDMSRFGVHVVASPRHADALVVTGPVALAMQEPLRRCYDAMAEPRMVIAVGASAISGVPWDGGYASANGVDSILRVSTYVPGNPPHPWYVMHGLLLAMGHPAAIS